MSKPISFSLVAVFLLGVTIGNTAAADNDEIVIENALLKMVDTIDVSAEVNGRLDHVDAREGEVVREGDVIATIDSTRARYELEEAEADLRIAIEESKNEIDLKFAQKSKEVAQAELQRSLDSNRRIRDSVSQSEIDRLRLLVEKNELEIELAAFKKNVAKLKIDLKQAKVDQFKTTLNQHRIEAPIPGMVVGVQKNKGEWVDASGVVLQLVRIDRLRVEGFLHANEATFDLTGTPVRFALQSPNGDEVVVDGNITFVSPEANPVNSQVRIWAEVDNSELKLRPGLRGQLIIVRD